MWENGGRWNTLQPSVLHELPARFWRLSCPSNYHPSLGWVILRVHYRRSRELAAAQNICELCGSAERVRFLLIHLPCPVCVEETLKEDAGGHHSSYMTSVPVQTRGLYRLTCKEGHTFAVRVNLELFELLFESGLEALCDGYAREAVSSFAAALERMFEFSIRVLLEDAEVPGGAVEEMWKTVAAQSERQLGMYVALKTRADKRLPAILSQTEASFRNGVIHKGNFPSPDEAATFGAAVFDLITAEINYLKSNHANALEVVRGRSVHKDAVAANPKEPLIYFGFGTAVSLSVEPDPVPDFRSAMEAVGRRLRRIRR